MQVVFDRAVAEKLRERYTVLDLETFYVDNKVIETFCVVSAENLVFSNLTNLDTDIELHNEFVEAVSQKNYKKCANMYLTMLGKFGGELDSYYDTIKNRYTEE